jgi:hypothetical protein
MTRKKKKKKNWLYRHRPLESSARADSNADRFFVRAGSGGSAVVTLGVGVFVRRTAATPAARAGVLDVSTSSIVLKKHSCANV